MNKLKLYNNCKEGARDVIFRGCLSLFHGPINILQVGAIETWDTRFRYGSGWSDFVWLEYIKEYGGTLTICDINMDHLRNSIELTNEFGLQKSVFPILQKGENWLTQCRLYDSNYDIVYLDGSNDPKETLEQFELCDRKKTLILCDDFKIKGTLLSDKYKDFKYYNIVNGFAVYSKL